MKLCESPDFRDAIRATREHFANLGLTEAFIEKDYYEACFDELRNQL